MVSSVEIENLNRQIDALSLEVNSLKERFRQIQPQDVAEEGMEVGLKVESSVREGDSVFKVTEE